MVEYIAKNLAIELMHQSSYLRDGDLLEVNGNLAKARIEAEPSADVVQVRHGKWLPTNDDNKKRCNKCDTVVLIAMYPMGGANYCPNCGAKMDA